MNITEKRLKKAHAKSEAKQKQLSVAKKMKDAGYSTQAIAYSLLLSESTVRRMLKKDQ